MLIAVFILVSILTSCRTQHITQKTTEYVVDTVSVKKLTDSISTLQVMISQQKQIITAKEESEKENTNLSVTNENKTYNLDGTLASENKTTIDYFKFIDKMSNSYLKEMIDYQANIIQNLEKKIETDSIKYTKHIADLEYSEQTTIEKPTFWQKIKNVFFGVVVGILVYTLIILFFLKIFKIK